MQDKISTVITNALNIDKTILDEKMIRNIIKYIKISLEENNE